MSVVQQLPAGGSRPTRVTVNQNGESVVEEEASPKHGAPSGMPLMPRVSAMRRPRALAAYHPNMSGDQVTAPSLFG